MADLQIRVFSAEDLDQAGLIARRLWGEEAPCIPEKIRTRIYQYLARYYFVPESPYSYAAVENGKLCAFLLASPHGNDDGSAADAWIAGQLTPEERPVFEAYRNYIDGNRRKEMGAVKPGEILLLLFASIRKGCGRLLMAEFEARCRKRKVGSVLLWTDNTCDFEYYHRNGFTEVSHFAADPSLPGMKLTTYLFRKTITPEHSGNGD